MGYTRREIKKACELAGIDPANVLLFLDDAKQMYAKSKTEPNPLTAQIIEIYHQWYIGKVGVKPRILTQDGTTAKSIAEYLSGLVQAKDPDCSRDEKVIQSWEVILSNFSKWDKFHQKQISLCQIGRNLNNIIASIKQVNGKSTGESSARNIAHIIQQRSSGL